MLEANTNSRTAQALVLTAGAACALVLALIAAHGDATPAGEAVTIFFYLASIFVFDVTSIPSIIPRSRSGGDALSSLAVGHMRRPILLLATAGALALNIEGDRLVYASLTDTQVSSVPGPVLWFVSLCLLFVLAVAAGSPTRQDPLWGTGKLPASPRLRLCFLIAVALLVILAVAARFVDLQSIPRGINADEGDRTATSISILRGFDTTSIFASGWYYISNFYFWLLAGVLRIAGIGYVQARYFGASASALTFCLTTWIGFRHFSARVAVLAAILGAVLGISLQFARETTEATQTAFLWTLSVALFLEAVRRNRPWLWVGSGVSGALSIYFYPTGRLWAVLGAAMCGYMFLWSAGRRRWDVLVGAVLMGVAALMTVGPFLANIALNTSQLSQRAQETSVFSGNNPTRLAYYDPHWSLPRLLWAQIQESLGIFSQVPDHGGFWPTQQPIMWGLLSILVYIGIGWTTLSWRDPRKCVLAIWFWVGFAGVIVTVETPNVQRMATAVPVLALIVALVLDDVARRIEPAQAAWGTARRLPLVGFGAAVVLGIAGLLAWQQFRFYFGDYAAMNQWAAATLQGVAVADQGPDTLVATVGRQFHQVNSGWVRLLAPNAYRGGITSPGHLLPLGLPADRDLAFVIYPDQEYYLPFLRSMYPGGRIHRYTVPGGAVDVTTYRISRGQWRSTQGALVSTGDGTRHIVSTLGTPPSSGTRPSSALSWSAELRVPQFWNYDFRSLSTHDTLSIDGRSVLGPKKRGQSASVSLARGLHFIRLVAVGSAGSPVSGIEWKAQAVPGVTQPTVSTTWHSISREELTPVQRPQGLVADSTVSGVLHEQELDGTLASCCIAADVNSGGHPLAMHWRGWLVPPRTGRYSMSLFSQGPVSFDLGGRSIMLAPTGSDTVSQIALHLVQGHRYAVDVRYRVNGTPGGLEWTWVPPGGTAEIVPPRDLQPPARAGIGGPIPAGMFVNPATQVTDVPLVTVR